MRRGHEGSVADDGRADARKRQVRRGCRPARLGLLIAELVAEHEDARAAAAAASALVLANAAASGNYLGSRQGQSNFRRVLIVVSDASKQNQYFFLLRVV